MKMFQMLICMSKSISKQLWNFHDTLFSYFFLISVTEWFQQPTEFTIDFETELYM